MDLWRNNEAPRAYRSGVGLVSRGGSGETAFGLGPGGEAAFLSRDNERPAI